MPKLNHFGVFINIFLSYSRRNSTKLISIIELKSDFEIMIKLFSTRSLDAQYSRPDQMQT